MEDPTERARRRQSWLDRGYGLVIGGPIYCPPYTDEHGVAWAPFTDWLSRDITIFYARMDELRADGLALEYVAISEAGPFLDRNGVIDFDACDRILSPIYLSNAFQDRFGQGDIQVAWEPDWLSAQHVRAAQLCRKWFPHARIRIHLERGHSAPGRSSELREPGTLGPTDPGFTEGDMWWRVAPLIDGFNMQSLAFLDAYPNLDVPDAAGVTPIMRFLYDIFDNGRRFLHGYADWPTHGYQGRPMDLHLKEFAAWWVSRGLVPEAIAVRLGDLALHAQPFTIYTSKGWETVDVRGMVSSVGDGRTVV